MKVYILGTGWIGKTIFDGLNQSDELNVSLIKSNSIKEIQKEKDVVLINCAGVGHPSLINEFERKREQSYIQEIINLGFRKNWSLIQISSASVISYIETYPEINADCEKTLSPYSTHKCVIENILLKNSANFKHLTIVRLFSLYGVNAKKQIIHDIFDRYNHGKHVYKLPALDVTRSFVSEKNLYKTIQTLIEGDLNPHPRIINLSGDKPILLKSLIEESYRMLNSIYNKEEVPEIKLEPNNLNPIIKMHPSEINSFSTYYHEDFFQNLFLLFKLKKETES